MKDQNSLPIGDQFINFCVLIMFRGNNYVGHFWDSKG